MVPWEWSELEQTSTYRLNERMNNDTTCIATLTRIGHVVAILVRVALRLLEWLVSRGGTWELTFSKALVGRYRTTHGRKQTVVIV